MKNNPKNFHDNFLKIKLSWDGTGRNLLLACESIVVGVVFLIGSKAWMVKGQHPHPPAETAVHLLLLVMCLSNCCSAVKKNLEFCRSHTYLITCLYEWKRFWHLKSVLFLVSKICLLYGELLPFLGMLTISNVSRSTWCWAQLSSGQDLGRRGRGSCRGIQQQSCKWMCLSQNRSQRSMELQIRFSRHPNWIRGIVLKICWLWNV